LRFVVRTASLIVRRSSALPKLRELVELRTIASRANVERRRDGFSVAIDREGIMKALHARR